MKKPIAVKAENPSSSPNRKNAYKGNETVASKEDRRSKLKRTQ